MRWSPFPLALTMIVASCGVSFPVGDDTYVVTEQVTPFYGDRSLAMQQAIDEAKEFCQKKERRFIFVTTEEKHGWYGTHAYSVRFRCMQIDPTIETQTP